MFNSIWRKALRDLISNKTRTLLVILAITAGVFGISVVANSFAILKREMNRNYMDTNPASATLITDYLSDAVIRDINALPYIEETERREKIVGRVQTGENEWKDIWLFVVQDFKDLRLDIFAPESGSSFPGRGEILFERKALTFTGAYIGQSVNVKIPGGPITALKLTGSVHAPGLAPSWMEGFAYGYITRDTFLQLGGMENFTELKVKVTGDTLSQEHINSVILQLRAYLSDRGITVLRTEIPHPGRHPHYSQMAALLFLMEAFGIVALFLSGVLVSNIMTTLMEQQIRQIGIMKSQGATYVQIAVLYLGIVIAFSTGGTAIAIPLGIAAGSAYADLAAQILNFKIISREIPAYVFLIEIAAGFLIPLVASSVPVIKSSRITIRQALQSYGVSQEKYSGRSSFVPFVSTILPRPLLLSLRNTFRRKGRLMFSLFVMAIGGTGFIIAMNIFSSMYATVDEKMDAFGYDIQITFEQPQPEEALQNVLTDNPGIASYELWNGAGAARVREDQTTGNGFTVIAPPADTKLMEAPPLYSGRWLNKDDTNAIVINQQLLSKEPDIKVGDSIRLRIAGIDSSWTVTGVSKELIGLPTAYVNMEYLSELLKEKGRTKSAVIKAAARDDESRAKLAQQIESLFSEAGIQISTLMKMDDLRTSLVNHLVIIASFLQVISLLVVIVGGLGLATMMSINTMERTREIGIMRAIGAPASAITGMLVTEGIIIGIISWLLAVILSWPLSRFVSSRFGIIFFEVPLEFAPSPTGYAIWLALVTLFAAAACFYPSSKASRMEINRAVYYE